MFNNKFKSDFYRNIEGKTKINIFSFIYYFLIDYRLRFLFYYRLKKNNIIRKIAMRYYSIKYGLDIYCDCGPGLYLGHARGITVNPGARIGKNCNIHKGVTIGQENRGSRKGAPIIGNDVWIGINAVIVGNVKIGNDVLIAPLTYVNFDIPDHSIVIGNPGKIIKRKNATKDYINNKV